MSNGGSGLGLAQGLVRLSEPPSRWSALFDEETRALKPAQVSGVRFRLRVQQPLQDPALFDVFFGCSLAVERHFAGFTSGPYYR